jgi:hypothetical protein
MENWELAGEGVASATAAESTDRYSAALSVTLDSCATTAPKRMNAVIE